MCMCTFLKAHMSICRNQKSHNWHKKQQQLTQKSLRQGGMGAAVVVDVEVQQCELDLNSDTKSVPGTGYSQRECDELEDRPSNQLVYLQSRSSE